MTAAIARLYPKPQGGPHLPTRPGWLVDWVERADLSPREWLMLCIAPVAGLGPAAVSAVVFGSLPVAGSLVLIGPGLALMLALGWSGRAATRAVAELPELLDAIARDTRAGATSTAALERAVDGTGPLIQRRLKSVLFALQRGAPIADAFARFVRPADPPAMLTAGHTLEFAHDSVGGADMLGAAASGLRDELGLAREVSALTAQTRLSAWVLICLPVGFVLVGLLAGSERTLALFTTPLGRTCLVAGLGLDTIGALWIRAQYRLLR